MSQPPVDRLFPEPATAATDEQLLEWYSGQAGGPARAGRTWVSFNFVSSIDGAAALDGHSGGLGNLADQRIFELLRRHADVILLGAQTVRTEGYAGQLLNGEARQWRTEHGEPAHPAIAVVSGSLALDPDSDFFTTAPVRPTIFTTTTAPDERRRALETVAEVVAAGSDVLDVDAVIGWLAEHGLNRIHSEGGPHLLGTFQAAGRVDELCLSLSAMLVDGQAPRITAGGAPADGSGAAGPRPMTLAHVLKSGDMLFLRYLRAEDS